MTNDTDCWHGHVESSYFWLCGKLTVWNLLLLYWGKLWNKSPHVGNRTQDLSHERHMLYSVSQREGNRWPSEITSPVLLPTYCYETKHTLSSDQCLQYKPVSPHSTEDAVHVSVWHSNPILHDAVIMLLDLFFLAARWLLTIPDLFVFSQSSWCDSVGGNDVLTFLRDRYMKP